MDEKIILQQTNGRFDSQIRITFLDYREIGRFISCILDIVQTPSISGNNSSGTITSYAHESLAVHLEYSNQIWMFNLVHVDMLSLSSKKDRNRKDRLETFIIGIDNKMTIDTLMKHFYIAVQYFYITN